ncbi:uncharacterized protein LOC144754524 [Lissotriton helveticus]
MPSITLPSAIIQEAKNILEPPAPPVSPIKSVREAKLRSLMTITGTISEEKETKNIFVSAQETKLKSITVIDTTDSNKITLWRDAADFPIKLGSYVKMTHLTVHEFNNEKMLNTTRNTQLEIIEPPKENITITIYGLENTTKEKSTITVQINDTEHFKSMDIQNTILMDYLDIPADIEDFGDALMDNLPTTVNVIFQNGSVIEIIEDF